MSIFIISSYVFAIAAFSLLAYHNRKLDAALKEAAKLLGETIPTLEKVEADKIDQAISRLHKAEVEERMEPIPHFVVYRMGVADKHDIIRVAYDSKDSDDRQYKRLHAEEVAEKLNERP